MTITEAARAFKAYCLGVGCMTKCETCQFEKNWQTLNEMPDALRLAMQSGMKRVDQTGCQLLSGKFWVEANKKE